MSLLELYSKSIVKIILLSFLLSACEKDPVVIPGIEPTYSIEEVVFEGQTLMKISGHVNESVSFTNSNLYLLSGIVFIEDTLDIEPGTRIFASTDPLTALVIERKAKIIANGSSENPIVFTSINKLQNSASPGDWGGIHINGQASLNNRVSGLVDLIGKYGRVDDTFIDQDNSGSLSYVRIEFAGKNMNGSSGAFNLNGVGNETTLNHIQTFRSLLNGIRFRGGTSRLKYAISTQTFGKGIRWDHGWRGYGQFWVVNYPETTQDTLTAIEGRSGDLNNPPISAPVLSNLSIIGLGSSSTDPQIRGIRFRDSTHGKVYNSIITRCRRGVRADNSQPFIDDGSLVFAYNNLFNNNPDYYTNTNSDAGLFENPLYKNTSNTIPMDGYIGTDESGDVFNITSIGNWFDTVFYKGAVPSNNNWTLGWSE